MVRIPYLAAYSRPLSYLIGYLLLIVIFAGIYYFLPEGSFYSPYAKFEPDAYRDTSEVSSLIEEKIHQSIRKSHQAGFRFNLDPKYIHVIHVELVDDSRLEVVVASDMETRFANIIGELTDVTAYIWLNYWRAGNLGYCHEVSFSKSGPYAAANSSGYNSLFKDGHACPSPAYLYLTPVEERRLYQYARGVMGDPRDMYGLGGRMLYFSAVTITTVGFGDIVPLTRAARAFVGLEPIAGWILAGFFLNSIARYR